jgi:hypothetical protein
LNGPHPIAPPGVRSIRFIHFIHFAARDSFHLDGRYNE